MFFWLVAASAIISLAVLLLPWRPWSTNERLRIVSDHGMSLSDVTALIPARDEASCIADTLRRLAQQGTFANIILIDDQSTDGTSDVAAALDIDNLTIINGATPPSDWSGKLWALEQGFHHVESDYVLLLDADIGLEPNVVGSLLRHLRDGQLDMASIMANLHMQNFWEKLLLPPFVYFFKLIYPFRLANSASSSVAAGAGGCVLLRADKLREIGGFATLRDAIIDDCTLAAKIKASSGKIWIGLSNEARALRPYESLENIWNMVARTAYTQLRYSPILLAVCTALLVITYIVPIVGLISGNSQTAPLSLVALGAMLLSYLPTIRFYQLPASWVFTLPAAAGLFLAMTWTSAIRYMRGERSRWKNRSYARSSDGESPEQ